MEFIDGKEHDPEDWGYLVLTKKDLEREKAKQQDDPNYKPSLEFVKEYNQVPVVYQYRVKLKEIEVGEGCHRGVDDYYFNKRLK